MNELFDKLILQILFTVLICASLIFYKYAHGIFYPSTRQHFLKRFYPTKNSSDTLHFFSRIIGIGIIFSEFSFNLSTGIGLAILDFFAKAIFGFFLYLISLYIIDSIVLFNFEYKDEVLKRKNNAYSVVTLAQSIGIAFILKTVLQTSGTSIVMLIFLWLFSMVLIGFASKTFPLMSKMSFNRQLIQKSIPLSFSYLGFFWGWVLIITSALDHKLINIKWYGIQVVLKILLSLIVLPIFTKGLKLIFRIYDEKDDKNAQDHSDEVDQIDLGYGVYEGSLFFTSCFLTIVITNRVFFGTFYPTF
ncbi:hypothetical protein OAT67_07750 [Bacteriovoracaceae bacterium]|nr:hypothetical protein [Bacteriovoracaceae bacterium]|tara:strand:+ start:2756 stop:3664 length:909 start_codon:yes stop_codon:yes gene_type:complete